MTPLHNGHILKWMRWQHWLATQAGHPFGILHWATQYHLELRPFALDALARCPGRPLVVKARQVGYTRIVRALHAGEID